MSDICNHLQHRIAQTKADLQSVTERIQQATAERDLLATELQGYEKALAAEMRRDGVPVPTPIEQFPLPIESTAGNEGTSKAEFARQFIREHSNAGVTPGGLYDGFISAGIPIKRPYIYSLVQRLQRQGDIRSRRGKYFPAQEPEKSSEAA